MSSAWAWVVWASRVTMSCGVAEFAKNFDLNVVACRSVWISDMTDPIHDWPRHQNTGSGSGFQCAT